MLIKRSIINILTRFKNKLIILSGPRQVGKTFIVQHFLKPDLSLNMDVAKERLLFKQFPEYAINWYEKTIAPFPKDEIPAKKPLIFIDEIHKVRGWRDTIKGTFDKTHHAIDFVASGSSAFKLRKQDRGDSLAGRAFWFSLSPVTFREYVETQRPNIALGAPWQLGEPLIQRARNFLNLEKEIRPLWDEYFAFGGFPENLINRDRDFYKKWLDDYVTAMLDRDLKDIGTSKDVERVYQTFKLLLEGMGSTYSLRSIAENLSAAPDTIKSDISALKQVLWGWDLPVASSSRAKQIRKEKKFYPIDFCFADYASPSSEGARFECAIACLLQRAMCGFNDHPPPGTILGFYRDYNKREVDLVAAKDRRILLAIECKTSQRTDASGLAYFCNEMKPQEAILAVGETGVFEKAGGYYMISAELLAAAM